MITIYRLFQVLMGIILSGFIFYFLISYAGDYALVGEETVVLKTLDVFLQDADSVYFSGNSILFEEFDDDYSMCHPSGLSRNILCYNNDNIYETRQLLIPIIMRPGDDTLITRQSFDYGWTRLDYVEATPEIIIVFNPIDGSPETWQTMMHVASAFPDTASHEPDVLFNICDGNGLLIENNDQSLYARDFFVSAVSSSLASTGKCIAPLSSNHVLVTISPSCSQSYSGSGICITPSNNGMGYAYLTGFPDPYVYKDPADLAALVLGGDRKNLFREPVGGETWGFKNDIMLSMLSDSAMFMERRCLILFQHPGIEDYCRQGYLNLMGNLTVVKNLANEDPHDMFAMTELKSALDKSVQSWDSLVEKGCEQHG